MNTAHSQNHRSSIPHSVHNKPGSVLGRQLTVLKDPHPIVLSSLHRTAHSSKHPRITARIRPLLIAHSSKILSHQLLRIIHRIRRIVLHTVARRLLPSHNSHQHTTLQHRTHHNNSRARTAPSPVPHRTVPSIPSAPTVPSHLYTVLISHHPRPISSPHRHRSVHNPIIVHNKPSLHRNPMILSLDLSSRILIKTPCTINKTL